MGMGAGPPPVFSALLCACAFALLSVGAGGTDEEGGGLRNLVLGVDHNVAEGELRIFLASLRSSGCTADVVLFSGGGLTARKQALGERHGAVFVAYDFASLNRTHGPVGVHRFHLYRRFLQARGGAYAAVLHTDVRDVMFQDDPFARVSLHGGGAFFLESDHLLIGTSPTNRGWLTDNCTVYAEERVLGRLQHRLRSCSGNMMGTFEAVLVYASMMEEEQQRTAGVRRDAAGNVVSGGWCADQAVHQVLLWTGRFAERMRNVSVHRNEDGPVCTMGDMPSIRVSEWGDVVNERGDLYAVVHQYDRHHRVRDTLRARYDEEDAPQHVNPQYIPDYKPRALVGDPSKISRHPNADTSVHGTSCMAPGACAGSHARGGGGGAPGGRTELQDAEEAHAAALLALMRDAPMYPEEEYRGRGVVMSAGGQLQVANAYASVRSLRAAGCALPIELFYVGQGEMSAEAVAVLERWDVAVIDITHVQAAEGVHLAGFQVKPFAMLHSSFREVLWLDSDNVPFSDPSALFDASAYQQTGCLFWQDLSVDPHWLDPGFFRAYGLEMVHGERELEAGQVVLDKKRCWAVLQLVAYMNRNYMHFYTRMYGDKDTWRVAFKLLGARFGLAPHAADVLGSFDPSGRFCGNAMLHKAPDGSSAFIHRTLQSLPGTPTPLPFESVSDETLRAVGQGAWTHITRGGMQRLQPRLDTTQAGWRVDNEEVDRHGREHWCLYVDLDPDVRIEMVGQAIHLVEAGLKKYMSELADLGVMSTLSETD